MKIQCDVCERAPATVICCADEAALCEKCDVEVHAANKLASKHQRLLLHRLSSKLPKCDICQDKAAFIFCVEDRALFCEDCDESIHSANTLAANHQRLLATGIQVALAGASCNNTESKKSLSDPPSRGTQQVSAAKMAAPPPPPQPQQHVAPSWSVDDLLHFSDFDTSYKQKEPLEFGEFEWLAEVGLLGEQLPQEAMAAAEVPQLPESQTTNSTSSYRPTKYATPYKKPRIETPIDDDEFFIVPDLG